MSEVTENENFIEIDETIRHEALDRCLMISDILGAHLLEHPFIETNEQLSGKIQVILDNLLEVYEEISEAVIVEGTKYAIEEIELNDEEGETSEDDISEEDVTEGEEELEFEEIEPVDAPEETEEEAETVAA